MVANSLFSSLRRLSIRSGLGKRNFAFVLPLALVGLGLLTPAPVRAEPSSLPGYVILPLTSMGRANQACIRATINGQSTMLMVDTGAYATVLDTRFYQGVRSKPGSVGEDQLPVELQHKVSANGEKAEVGYISSMTSGAMNFSHGPVVVTDLSRQLNQFNNLHHAGAVGGLLGEDILHKYSAFIDWRRRGIYFNTDPARRMNVGRAFVAAGWTAVPMSPTSGRHYTVQCTIEGKPVRLLVDTGAQFTTLRTGVMPLPIIYNRDTGGSMARLASTGMTMSMIGMDSSSYPARLEHWKIGDYEIAKSNVAVNKFPAMFGNEQSSGDGPLLGVLGAEVLAANNAIIDISGSALYLKAGSNH